VTTVKQCPNLDSAFATKVQVVRLAPHHSSPWAPAKKIVGAVRAISAIVSVVSASTLHRDPQSKLELAMRRKVEIDGAAEIAKR